jgi:uncharacterized damage-inducible protein DinB
VQSHAVLLDLLDRLPGLVRAAVEGLTPDQLHREPAPGANTVGWLVWHLTRVQDHHVAEVAGEDQVWADGDLAARFGLPADPSDTGYGHSREQVLAVRPQDWHVLVEYHEAVSERTRRFVAGLSPEDLERVVDRRWDPPVTLGVRLASVLSDDLQHVGQAAYARGLLDD